MSTVLKAFGSRQTRSRSLAPSVCPPSRMWAAGATLKAVCDEEREGHFTSRCHAPEDVTSPARNFVVPVLFVGTKHCLLDLDIEVH